MFYNAGPMHYVITGGVGLIGGVVVGLALQLVSGLPLVGLWLTIIAGPAIGGAMAEALRRAVGKSRGQYTWLVAAITIGLGAAIFVLPPVVRGLANASLGSIFALVPVLGLVLTISAVIARMRI